LKRLARLGVMSGLLAISSAHSPLFAQQGRSVEAGVAFLRFPDDSVSLIGPWARVAMTNGGPRYVTALSAGGVVAPGGASGSASLAGAWRAIVRPHWVLEGGGEGSLIFSTSSGSAQSALVSARLITGIGDGGIWLRATGDLARRETGVLPGRGVGAGAWHPIPHGVVSASIVRQWSEALLFDANFRSGLLGTVPVRYTEGGVDLQLDGEVGTLALAAGARRDPDAAERLEPALSASAVLWQTSSRAFTVSVMRLPADFVHRADALRMVTIGMRFGERPGAAQQSDAARPTVTVTDREGVQQLRVRAPGARHVEVMGDFTGWEPVELSPKGELFERTMPIASGTHRLLLRIDGGTWIPAANTPPVNDDLGGRVGLLVVP
jgi:hypothetical protein